MPFDFQAFRGELPFDAQYVGVYQPLLGWIGRTGKRRFQSDVRVLVHQVLDREVPRVATDRGPAVGGGRPVPGRPVPSDRPIDPTIRPTMTGGGWADTLVGRAGLRIEGGPNGGNGGGVASGRGPAVVMAPPEARPFRIVASEDSARPSATTTATMRAFDRLRESTGFVANLEVSLREGSLRIADLLGWLDEFDFTRSASAQLLISPIGILNLYREYYFDCGTRLGPPVEHVWIAPGSDVEMTESYTRTEYSFLEVETATETVETVEETTSESETFSEEVEREQQRDISLGVSAEGGVNFPVWHAGGSASFDYANSLRQSKRQTRERTREVSKKVSKELRRRQRVLSRTSTEVQRANTRRHRISNPSAEVRNLELRRKHQVVGVQVQHLGTALCWQTYVGRPGDHLALPELVHVGAADDFLATPPPDTAPVNLPPISEEFQVTVPFTPVRTLENSDRVSDTDNDYFISAVPVNGVVVATDDAEEAPDDSDDVIQAAFSFRKAPPAPGYVLKRVQDGVVRGTDPSEDPPSLWSVRCTVSDEATGEFEVRLLAVNFQDNPSVEMTVDLLWEAPPAPILPPNVALDRYTAEMQRKARKAIADAVRERVRLASAISARDSDDMRAEERSVIYRKLIEGLVGSAAGRDLHVLSEVIQTIFDVEKMLYFVAPDWWDPRRSYSQLRLPSLEVNDETVELSDRDRTRFGQDGDGRPTYLITEESKPAPLGRSLGWIAQLDGDDRRNAFLNSPWVKAVLPVRPGREEAAITFLRQAHVEDSDGLGAEHVDELGNRTGQTLEQRLRELARTIRMNSNADQVYEAGQIVYERGFDPLPGGVMIGGAPLDTFAQWIEVVPTKQIVPVNYVPPAPFAPPGAGGVDG